MDADNKEISNEELFNEEISGELKPLHKTTTSSFLRTIISLALFIAVDYWIFKNWGAVFLLVTVIFLHELGHFIAMKIFRYKGIKMTFVPFMGAYVSGEGSHFSKYKKIIMLLAGPLPGIVIGMMLLFLYQQNFNEDFYLAALAFLLLNLFNLLPVSPLDGGQFIDTLLSGSQLIEMIFLFFSLLILFYFLHPSQSWFLIVIASFIFIRISSLYLVYSVRGALDKKGVAYDCSYDDLTDEHYAQIRDVLVTKNYLLSRRFSPGQYAEREGELVKYIERILAPAYHFNLTGSQKITFLLVYLFSFILPGIQWGFFKGWF